MKLKEIIRIVAHAVGHWQEGGPCNKAAKILAE